MPFQHTIIKCRCLGLFGLAVLLKLGVSGLGDVGCACLLKFAQEELFAFKAQLCCLINNYICYLFTLI